MENQELILRSEALLCEESTLSPEKEQAYIERIDSLENEINYLYEQLGVEKPVTEEPAEEAE